jgi:glycine dehydrogenase subunit 1
MLRSIGVNSIDDLLTQIPEDLLVKRALNVPGPLSEMELSQEMSAIAVMNANLSEYASFLGAGIYDHYIPATVGAITGRSEFYTSYTPYQPELSQGNLQAIWEFQSLVCELTGMQVANASMYDGASALAEAAMMTSGINRRREWVVSGCLHPSYLRVLRTYAWAAGFDVRECCRSGILTDSDSLIAQITDDTACVIVQNPNFFGALESLTEMESAAHRHGALFVMSVDPISLGILKTPGDYNADICVAEGQSLGISQGYGGPLLGLFACKQEFVRHMPGRIAGATVDEHGKRAYTLTLQTREQHIRRERATSNICTNEALLALAASVYLCTLGKKGLTEVANLCLQKSHYAAEAIGRIPGFELPCKAHFFKEFVVKSDSDIRELNRGLMKKRIVGGLDLGRFYPDLQDHMLFCATEKRTKAEIDSLIDGMAQS